MIKCRKCGKLIASEKLVFKKGCPKCGNVTFETVKVKYKEGHGHD
jgi:predicted  nucleic acid-binding Zn-ribbon protein